MDILKKELAPITSEAWEEIIETSQQVFNNELAVRKFADVDGPHGLKLGAVSRGRIDIPENQETKGLEYGLHQVQPLIETRAHFSLDIWELDNVVRGAEDIDLEALEDAARKIAGFEERTIYTGLKEANLKGLINNTEYKAIGFPEDPSRILHHVTEAITKLKSESVEGPYSLVVDKEKWEMISAYIEGYPLRLQLENILNGKIILAPHYDGAFLVSERGGDFRLTLGQDLSIGYLSHGKNKVELYFTESFTFQVLDPAAIIFFK